METVDAAEFRVVVTTLPDAGAAERVARALVEERLAACVNIVPGVRSIYRWQGAVEDQTEHLCLIKTSAAQLAALSRRLGELHPYDVPELLAFTPALGAAAYLGWIGGSVG